jgi:hypothetical protein
MIMNEKECVTCKHIVEDANDKNAACFWCMRMWEHAPIASSDELYVYWECAHD